MRYIYLVEITGHGLCKIGISRNPKNRISNIQSHIPFEIRHVATLAFDDDVIARGIERRFKERMDHWQCSGEWFRVSSSAALSVLSNILHEGHEIAAEAVRDCEQCGQDLGTLLAPSDKRRFCSRQCFGQWMRDKNMRERQRQAA